nr:MAG TPA: Pyocin activator protein PrtN [Caudoviricetes sp.]
MPKLIDMTGSARILGTTPSTIYQRLCAGWSELEAVTVPVGMRRRKNE